MKNFKIPKELSESVNRQTIQWVKEKGQKDKQRSENYTEN